MLWDAESPSRLNESQTIVKGVYDWFSACKQSTYATEDGEIIKPQICLIDCGFKYYEVLTACKNCKGLVPIRGRANIKYSPPTKTELMQGRTRDLKLAKVQLVEGMPLVTANVDLIKEHILKSIVSPIGLAGSISIGGTEEDMITKTIAHEITSEYIKAKEEVNGQTKYHIIWDTNRRNELLDALVYGTCGALMLGGQLIAVDKKTLSNKEVQEQEYINALQPTEKPINERIVDTPKKKKIVIRRR